MGRKIAFIDASRPGGTGAQCARYLLELGGFDTIILAAALADEWDAFKDVDDPSPQANRDVVEAQRWLLNLPCCTAPGASKRVLVLPHPAAFAHCVLSDDASDALLADLIRLGIDHIDAVIFNAAAHNIVASETFARRQACFYPSPPSTIRTSVRHPMQQVRRALTPNPLTSQQIVARQVTDFVAHNCGWQFAWLGAASTAADG